MMQNSEREQTEPVSVVIGLKAAPGSRDDLAGPVVQIEPASRKPLRLNNGRLNLHGKTDAADAFSRIKEYLLTICGPWSRQHHLFIDTYFAFIDEQCERHRAELNDILAPFGSVYSYRDFRFSAWLPLPLAVVDSSTPPQPEQPLPRADFLFWSGTEFIAVELCGHTSRSNKRIRELDQLRQAGVRIVDTHLSQLRADHGAQFIAAFPSDFSRFWAGERFPSGPLKPENARFVLTPQR
ncbi:MAG: hypothetical protein ACTHLY_08950 [Pseudolabrys sp.]